VPLLNAYVEKLKIQQIKKIYTDAVSTNVDRFKHVGMYTEIFVCRGATDRLCAKVSRNGRDTEMSGVRYDASIVSLNWIITIWLCIYFRLCSIDRAPIGYVVIWLALSVVWLQVR
jgi:hypothetical protein